jgi:ATP11 protein
MLKTLRLQTRRVFNLPVPKKLDEVVKIPLFEQLSSEEVKQFWLHHFSQNDRVVAGVMSTTEWEIFNAK